MNLLWIFLLVKTGRILKNGSIDLTSMKKMPKVLLISFIGLITQRTKILPKCHLKVKL